MGSRRLARFNKNGYIQMKKAFITGIAGQDGSYLAEYLLELGYEVHGIVRRNSTAENQDTRIVHLEDKIKTYYGDLLDQGGLERLLDKIQYGDTYADIDTSDLTDEEKHILKKFLILQYYHWFGNYGFVNGMVINGNNIFSRIQTIHWNSRNLGVRTTIDPTNVYVYLIYIDIFQILILVHTLYKLIH